MQHQNDNCSIERPLFPALALPWRHASHDVHAVLRRIRSTMYLRNLEHDSDAKQAQLQDMFPDSWEEKLQEFKSSGRDDACSPTVRRGRVRLEQATCLVRRNDFENENTNFACRFLAADASPERGLEIFGALEDIFHMAINTIERRPFSLTTLGYGHASLFDKGFALLWLIFLIVGPSEAALQRYLDSVFAVLSDFGVESGWPKAHFLGGSVSNKKVCRRTLLSKSKTHINDTCQQTLNNTRSGKQNQEGTKPFVRLTKILQRIAAAPVQ